MSKKIFYAVLFALLFSMYSCDNEEVVFDLPEDPDVEVPDDDKDDDGGDEGEDGDEGETPEPIIEKFINPLNIKDKNSAVILDPSVIKVNEKFYLFSASEGWTDGTRPLIGIFESEDLVNWIFVREAISTSKYKDKIGDWLQGVRIFKDSNKYCIYFISNNKLRCFISDTPNGEFEAYDDSEGIINLPDGFELGYDPITSFITDGDKKYMLLRNKSGEWDTDLYLIEMVDYKTFEQPTVSFKISDENLQSPSLAIINNKYYLFTKNAFYFGTEPYRIFTSDKLTGNYTYTGQDFLDNSKNVNGIGSFVKDSNNDYWALYSVFVDDTQKHKLYLDKVEFENGLPQIKGLKPSTTEQPAPVFKKEEQNPQ